MDFSRLKFARLAGRGAVGVWCSLLIACVELGRKDAFPVASQPLDGAALRVIAGQDGVARPFNVSADGHPVAAYYLRHPQSRGILLFFGGSGNQVDAPLKVVGSHAAALGLDLVVFSYYQAGEATPSVAEVRAKAVYAAVKALHTPASKSVYLLGHSLGGWFALDVAASEEVRGLVLAGAETTPAEVIRRTYSPWANLVAIQPDDDAKQLDASLYAPRVQTRTLVFTSQQDEAVPTAVAQRLFGMLPMAAPKRLVVLNGVTHGRYFLSEEYWRQFAEFFHLRSVH